MDLNFPGYYFYDINARITRTFSQSGKLFLSFYKGKDKIQYKDESSITKIDSETISDFSNETSGWGNIVGSSRWNHTFGNNLFVNTTIAYSHYNYFIIDHYYGILTDTALNKTVAADYSASYKSGISDLVVKSDFDLSISNNHKLTFGSGNTFHGFNPGTNTYNMFDIDSDETADTSYTNKYLHASEPFIYVEDEIALTRKLTLQAGMRVSGLISEKKINISPEPRLSANYAVSHRFVLKAGYSKMVQYLHLLSTAGLCMPTDIWVPALKGLQPLKSDQINAGAAYDWNNVVLVSIEIYRKWLNNTTDLKNGASLLKDQSPWYEKTTQGNGNSKGIEISVEKQEGRVTGSVNYTCSKADRKYHDLNNGKSFPFKYDRRHDLNVSVNYQISKKWDISVLWLFGTGYPVTVPIEKYYPQLSIVYKVQHNLVYYYPSLYNYRLPNYSRLDIGIHYKTQSRRCEKIISLDVFNVCDNNNPVNMYYMLNYSFKYIYLFPIIPSVSYTVKFK